MTPKSITFFLQFSEVFYPFGIGDIIIVFLICLTRASAAESEEGRSLGQGLADLEEAREEVVAEVLNAPKRRVDKEDRYVLTISSMILKCICNTQTESDSLLTSLSTLLFGAFRTSATTSSLASSKSARPWPKDRPSSLSAALALVKHIKKIIVISPIPKGKKSSKNCRNKCKTFGSHMLNEKQYRTRHYINYATSARNIKKITLHSQEGT